jgi:hypothetical protein
LLSRAEYHGWQDHASDEPQSGGGESQAQCGTGSYDYSDRALPKKSAAVSNLTCQYEAYELNISVICTFDLNQIQCQVLHSNQVQFFSGSGQMLWPIGGTNFTSAGILNDS